MQINPADDLDALAAAWAAAGSPTGRAGAPSPWDGYIQGACWALARVSGMPADDLEAYVRAAAAPAPAAPIGPRDATPIPAGIAPAPVFAAPTTPTVPASPLQMPGGPDTEDQGLGFYARDPLTGRGVMPVTRLADPLPEADMTVAPAPPTPGSYSDEFEHALEAGDPALMPMDDDTYAAVMDEIRNGSEPQYDAEGKLIPSPAWPAAVTEDEPEQPSGESIGDPVIGLADPVPATS